jgi:transcriptional antiterminator NusG
MRDRRIIVGVFSDGEIPLVLTDEKIAEIMDMPETIIRLEDERIDAITPKVGGKAQIKDGPFMGFYVDVTKVEDGRVWYEFAFGSGRIKGESGIGSVQRVAR